MSRRFQHQSSSASSVKFAKPQSHPSPSPASASRSSRFTRPCSTQQQPLSTPGTSTSRFRDRPSLKDEIETSFEEPDQSSPRLPSRSRFSSSVSQYRDVDDLDDENEEDDLNTNNLPPRSHPDQSGEIQDDELADLEFLERLRGTRGSQYPRQHEIDSPSEDEFFATPIAARKRRRLENRTDHAFSTIDDVDHQPDIFPKQPTSNKENHNKEPATTPPASASGSASESNSDLSSSPLVTPTNPQPSTATARFRLKPAHPQISASSCTSLAHTTPTAKTPGPRPLFRPNPKQHPPTSPSLNAQLPPAFSPSRHRGGGGRPRDYLTGGAADTVRNLILGFGVTEAQGQGQGQGQGGSRGIERVRVACVLRGSLGGGCVMFRDEAGRGWVLIGLGASDGMGGKGERKRVAIANGCVVGVRMGWEVDLSMKCMDTQEKEEEDGEDGRDAVWKVAVLWDVLDA